MTAKLIALRPTATFSRADLASVAAWNTKAAPLGLDIPAFPTIDPDTGEDTEDFRFEATAEDGTDYLAVEHVLLRRVGGMAYATIVARRGGGVTLDDVDGQSRRFSSLRDALDAVLTAYPRSAATGAMPREA